MNRAVNQSIGGSARDIVTKNKKLAAATNTMVDSSQRLQERFFQAMETLALYKSCRVRVTTILRLLGSVIVAEHSTSFRTPEPDGDFALMMGRTAMIRSKIASRFKRATTMAFLWALLALALHVVPGAVGPVHAQGTRKDDIVFNSRGVPLAGAAVRVCAMPASGQPCTPLALIYSDAALTQALANPTTTDGLGNYFFYAAPGKYEIEISGPAITTKQIPNVILPNDPASPTFSGAISAFSLTLSGNLTVSGNTTVLGNLASGTLNLANQSTPPGSASSGTVNLYTKTADKRLYYKDDAGVESGPLGAGAQTNAVNTFTANQNLDAGLHIKGPDPYSDMARYGGYFNASPPTTTASCTNASTSVTLAAALDYQDASKFPGTNVGNGIVLYQCGAATGLTTPPAPAVTPFGVTGGATTYNYKYVAEDFSGGLTAASAQGSSTAGGATLRK